MLNNLDKHYYDILLQRRGPECLFFCQELEPERKTWPFSYVVKYSVPLSPISSTSIYYRLTFAIPVKVAPGFIKK